ncbi:MAG: acyltransferase [Ignavibacteriae bacterium]|nr:acyltransferase [Ignavibacteriota bacterium]
MEVQQKEEHNLNFHSFIDDKKTSRLGKYQDIVIGNRKIGDLFLYELFTFLFANMFGLLGLLSRQLTYPKLFKKLGKKTTIGNSVSFKQAKKISIEKGCVIDDLVNLSVRGSETSAIKINEKNFVGRATEIKVREGEIKIDSFSSIGSNCRISIANGNIEIGKYVFIAAYCYIGGGNHKTDRIDIPIAHQGFDSKGGVYIGDDVWIGANSVIADGVKIGKGSIIGACSFVNKDVPEYSIVFGIPAKVHKSRI